MKDLLGLVQRRQSFQQRWVREVPHGVEPVTQWKAEIVTVQFDESAAEVRGTTQPASKRIGLKLKMSTKYGHAE